MVNLNFPLISRKGRGREINREITSLKHVVHKNSPSRSNGGMGPLLCRVQSGHVNTPPGWLPRSVTRTGTRTGRQRATPLTGAGARALVGRYRFAAVHRAAPVTDLSTVTTMRPPGKTPTTAAAAAAGPGQ